MTAPSYTSDLTMINNAETGTWTEFATPYNAGASPVSPDADYYIQGSGCTSQALSASKSGLIFSLAHDYGSDLASSITAGKCVFFWQVLLAGNAMNTFANGGLRLAIGSSLSDLEVWISGGNDFGRNPYGGWANIAIDPTYNSSTPDYTIGTPSGAYQFFGSIINTTAVISKGNVHGVDAIRYGRGELVIEYGELALGYGTFSGIATQNDNTTNSWGLFQAEGIGYLWKGLMSFGNTTNACDFRDSNTNITVDNTPRTYAAFNKIEITNASSRVDWDGINITTLDAAQLSPGDFEVITDTADVNFDNCVFTDMNTFIFGSTSTVNTTTFRRCAQVTQNGGVFDGCSFTESDAAVSILASNPTNIDNCDFTSDGSNHAIELSTANGATYYASDATPGDPGPAWTSDANAYDGSTATSATTSTAGTVSTNYLEATGTNAPGTGSTITDVQIRIYGSVVSGDTLYAAVATTGWAEVLGTAENTQTTAGWGSFIGLSIPSGGWTWTKVQQLDTRLYKTGTAGTVNAYSVDIAVFTSSETLTGHTYTGYAATDGSTGNEVIYNNSSGPVYLNISGGNTPTIRNGTSASTIVVSAVTVTIHVENENQTDIENARVYVTRDSDSSIIINGDLTDVSGDVSGSTVSGAGGITIKVRKSSSGTTRYYPVSATATVSGSDLGVNITMSTDTIAST